MVAEPLLLGIDLGTGSVKATLMNRAGQVLAETNCAYEGLLRIYAGAEVDPSIWWAAVVDAVASVKRRQPGPILAVGIAGQMHGVVLLDAENRPVRPAITWTDGRTDALASSFVEPALRGGRSELPNPVIPGMAALSLMWLAEHEPNALSRAVFAVQPKDWLGARMTGNPCSDPTDASATLLWDFEGERWDDGLIERIGLERGMFPEILPGEHLRGTLLPEPADELGLSAGISISVGLADTAASMLGNGCLEPPRTQMTVGSGGQICRALDEPRRDPLGATHLFRGALPGQWYSAAAIASAGLALSWVRSLFDLDWSEFYDEAFAEPAAGSDLVFHPYVAGERTPFMDSRLRGDWIGLSLQDRRPQLIRAALEGTAFALRDAWDELRRVAPSDTILCLAGGGSFDPRWRQLLANALETPLWECSAVGGSGRGAALTAGCAVGWYESLARSPWSIDWHPGTEPNAERPQLLLSLHRFRATQGAQRLTPRQ